MNTQLLTNVETFIETYLRPLQHQPKKEGRLLIRNPGFRPYSLVHAFLGGKPSELPAVTVADPTSRLTKLLLDVERTGNPDVAIPGEVVLGYSGCVRHSFYGEFNNSFKKGWLLSPSVEYPPHLVVPTPDGGRRWTRPPEHGTEQLYHFIFHVRCLMEYLAKHPIGKKMTTSTSEVAQMLSMLPRRAVFIRSGDEIGVLYTQDTPPMVTGSALRERLEHIQTQTRQFYCRPKAEAEKDQRRPPDDHEPYSRSEVI